MTDFTWELGHISDALKQGLADRQNSILLRPHGNIWGDKTGNFEQVADSILDRLPTEQVRPFLSVCLGSYLLDPRKAPAFFPTWIQRHTAVSEILGSDVLLEDLKMWRWGRAAFPVVDELENGKNDTIYYALVAVSPSAIPSLVPSWSATVLNADALDAVTIAAELVQKAHPEAHFYFWPFINPKKPTHDRSLGLPVYLSLTSLAIGKQIPMFIATGEIDCQGLLHPVQRVLDKCSKVFNKNYKKFIYPDDGSCLESRREQKAIGVVTLLESEIQWGIRKKTTVIDDKDKASLVIYLHTICLTIIGSDNMPNVLISAFDTKNEELPPNIIATHEYMIVVDLTKVKCVNPRVNEAFASFLGKKICCHKTESLNWLYWGEGYNLIQ